MSLRKINVPSHMKIRPTDRVSGHDEKKIVFEISENVKLRLLHEFNKSVVDPKMHLQSCLDSLVTFWIALRKNGVTKRKRHGVSKTKSTL